MRQCTPGIAALRIGLSTWLSLRVPAFSFPTAESYSRITHRRQIVKRAKTGSAPPMSDAAVKAKTDKVWAEWFAILDKWGAKEKQHKEIAAYLYKERKLFSWWAQMVTVGYERARGLRAAHQTAEGFNASRSKIFAAPLSRLYAAWKDEKARSRWMKGTALEVSTARPNKALRGVWNGGKSRVEILFYAKGPGKSQVTIDHRKLKSARAVQGMKEYWSEQLERLETLLKK
jgi:hypothetical protein